MPRETSHIDLVEDYFDNRASRWSAAYQNSGRANDVILGERQDLAVEFLSARLPQGARILDVGCGAGFGTLALVRRGYVVHGIDVAGKMVELAEKNLTEAGAPAESWSFAKGGLDGDALEPGSFDGLMALGVIEYNEDQVALLRQMAALLRPGGALVVTGPIRRRLSNLYGLTEMRARRRERARGKQQGAKGVGAMFAVSMHGYSAGRMCALVREAGLEVEAWRGHGFAGFPLLSKLVGAGGERFVNRFLNGLSRVLPLQRLANDLVLVARKPEARS
jgi:2-polyprenyl-3-methyl-5-hydroxy-6-metoxy-1,4-benzoquinol methylase